MANTIAEYYADELDRWKEAIDFYNQEIAELEEKLEEVIRRNSIIGIAEKVETYQHRLNQVSGKFYKLQNQMQTQDKAIRSDNTFLDDLQMDEQSEKRQSDLRQLMQATEKEYVDSKFDCYNFLSETLKKK